MTVLTSVKFRVYTGEQMNKAADFARQYGLRAESVISQGVFGKRYFVRISNPSGDANAQKALSVLAESVA